MSDTSSAVVPALDRHGVSLRDRTRQLAAEFDGDRLPAPPGDQCVVQLRASFESAIQSFIECAKEEVGVEQNRALEKLQRYAHIKRELRKLSVSKTILAFHAIKDHVVRGPDGRLQSTDGAPLSLLIARLVCEHPELIWFAD